MPKKTAVIYCRTSTKGQRDAATIEAQITACKRLIESHGLQLVTSYGDNGWIKDDGVSGSLLAGRKLAKLIDDLETDRLKVDYLVTYSMSRLARHDKSSKDRSKLRKSAEDKAAINAVLSGAGVMIVDTDGVNDPASVLTEIKQTLSGEEYRGIRAKTMEGKARVLGTGAWATGGRVPYGYKRVFRNGHDKKQGTTLAIDPVDGPRMVQLMEWYCEGGATYAAKKAMENKWPAPRGTKLTWYPSTVQQLRNAVDAQLGSKTLSVDGAQFEVTYPALLDSRLIARIERRKKEYTKKDRTQFLSTGFVDCSCGRHMHVGKSTPTSNNYVHCRGRHGTFRETVFAKKLWEAIVARHVQIRDSQTATKGKDTFASRLAEVKAKLAEVTKQQERLVTLYTAEAIEMEIYVKQNAGLKSQRTALQAEHDRIARERDDAKRKAVGREAVKDQVADVLRRLKSGRVDLESQRTILSDLLSGERVLMTWLGPEKKGERSASVTLPAFGSLKPVTINLQKDVTTQLLGASREVIDLIYDVDDAVDDVAL